MMNKRLFSLLTVLLTPSIGFAEVLFQLSDGASRLNPAIQISTQYPDGTFISGGSGVYPRAGRPEIGGWIAGTVSSFTKYPDGKIQNVILDSTVTVGSRTGESEHLIARYQSTSGANPVTVSRYSAHLQRVGSDVWARIQKYTSSSNIALCAMKINQSSAKLTLQVWTPSGTNATYLSLSVGGKALAGCSSIQDPSPLPAGRVGFMAALPPYAASVGSFSQFTVSAVGNSTAPTSSFSLGVNVDRLSFGTVVSGSVSEKSVTLSNLGTVTVYPSISLPAVPFLVSSNSCPAALAASTSCSITVQYAPVSPGTSVDLLLISAPLAPGVTYNLGVSLSGSAQ